jgi:peptidoglycan hydrolase-like protein with peptidoglycan-binding domain
MLKRRIGAMAAGIMIATGGLVALSTAPASASTPCVYQEFGTWDAGTYETCVSYEQILLNDLARVPGGNEYTNQVLSTDGYYGSHTQSDVEYFQAHSGLGTAVDGITGIDTWTALCEIDWSYQWWGTYWQAAGCAPIAE